MKRLLPSPLAESVLFAVPLVICASVFLPGCGGSGSGPTNGTSSSGISSAQQVMVADASAPVGSATFNLAVSPNKKSNYAGATFSTGTFAHTTRAGLNQFVIQSTSTVGGQSNEFRIVLSDTKPVVNGEVFNPKAKNPAFAATTTAAASNSARVWGGAGKTKGKVMIQGLTANYLTLRLTNVALTGAKIKNSPNSAEGVVTFNGTIVLDFASLTPTPTPTTAPTSVPTDAPTPTPTESGTATPTPTLTSTTAPTPTPTKTPTPTPSPSLTPTPTAASQSFNLTKAQSDDNYTGRTFFSSVGVSRTGTGQGLEINGRYLDLVLGTKESIVLTLDNTNAANIAPGQVFPLGTGNTVTLSQPSGNSTSGAPRRIWKSNNAGQAQVESVDGKSVTLQVTRWALAPSNTYAKGTVILDGTIKFNLP